MLYAGTSAATREYLLPLETLWIAMPIASTSGLIHRAMLCRLVLGRQPLQQPCASAQNPRTCVESIFRPVSRQPLRQPCAWGSGQSRRTRR